MRAHERRQREFAPPRSRTPMELTKIPLFEMLTRRMGWLNERQKVLAQNIANADTPNYVPRDLEPLDFESLTRSKRLRLAVTDANHVGPRGLEATARERAVKTSYEASPAGNQVVLEQQLLNVADTRMDYELTTTLYKKSVGLIRMALGKR